MQNFLDNSTHKVVSEENKENMILNKIIKNLKLVLLHDLKCNFLALSSFS